MAARLASIRSAITLFKPAIYMSLRASGNHLILFRSKTCSYLCRKPTAWFFRVSASLGARLLPLALDSFPNAA